MCGIVMLMESPFEAVCLTDVKLPVRILNDVDVKHAGYFHVFWLPMHTSFETYSLLPHFWKLIFRSGLGFSES